MDEQPVTGENIGLVVPRSEDDPLSAPDLFRCRGALLGVQDIWMLFSSPLQARETLNRIRTGVELVL